MSRSSRGVRRALHVLLGLAAAACAPQVRPPAAPVASVAATESTPAHETFVLQSGVLGEARPINVWTPPGYRRDPGGRWPVLYMPDGGLNEDFPHVVKDVDSLIARGAIRPVIVVGIPNTQRRRDLTGPTRVKEDSAIAPRVGGSAAFRRFIRSELFPVIDSRYRVTGERSIIGESLAGLFVLETLFLEPDLFTHHASLDPSLFWNDEALVESVAQRVKLMDRAPRTLYLATANYAPTIAAAARIDAQLRAAAPAGLRWTYVPHPELTHANIFLGTQAEALVHALR